MNVVDSSGWIAFFADTKNARQFEKPIHDASLLVVPTVVMYEVFKVMLREKGEGAAVLAQAHMQQGLIVELSADLAVRAAEISVGQRIPMADSMILATALKHRAIVWTQDEHFKGMRDVNYFST